MARKTIRFRRQGREIEVAGFHPRTTFLDYLRLQERSLGTKEGCAEGDCGACTVAVGRVREGRLVYEPVNACILLLGQVDGAEVVTVEDLASAEGLHPVQAALVKHHGSQCGFCTPGIVMSLFTLYHEGERPVSRQAVNDTLAGNLCRCTGYRPIMDAALEACASGPVDVFWSEKAARARHVSALDEDRRDVFVGEGSQFFAAPANEASLAALYAQHPDATLVAGCTDVGLWITKGLADIRKIIWLGRVSGLDRIEDGPETLVLGAAVTHAGAFDALAGIDPDLGEIMRRFGSVQVRASGTVGGSIANGSPIGDLAPALIALDASLELRQGDGVRTLPLENFFIAYRKQDRLPGEYVRRLLVPKLRSGEVFRAYKVSKRFDEDISSVLGAFRLTLDGRRIASARIAFGGMAGIPKRAVETEAALLGASFDDSSSWQNAFEAMARDYQPLDDHRASASYRATVARNLVLKALSEIAHDSTGATRIVGHRGPLAAAE
ncbi:xanthine dehydrogenase small subunit [Microvirga pudoricolor]|uniref:xanthine dehydrogenase small subunit n=1 Tax=Microvirga pudoricolor TaxID=2778729 RepID=UPI00195150FF|nr:xanthine dehydrogenase small subunit [Microvirga pudoricolor]MBM6592350.1 xanthine dehydrogenase small subunit [Microvirga pudoricolor]